jgi:hypothetical protein
MPKLHECIETVRAKQLEMYQFGVTVDLIAKQYQRHTTTLKQAISLLDDKEINLNAQVAQMVTCQERLEHHQRATQTQLRETQRCAAQQRQRKLSCEQQYYRVYGIPLISKQTEKKYIKARDQNLEIEQQLAELRHELERCRQEMKTMMTSSAQQFNEKGQVSFQRRGSVDTLNNKKTYLAYLQKGCAFWSCFDTYQAQVMLESAEYLLSYQPSKKGPLDVDEVWKRTFNMTCDEYNQLQEEGKQWDNTEVQYECDACHQTHLGWPHVQQEDMLVCDQCTSSKPLSCSMPQHQKMKRLFHTFLFPILS